MKVPRDLAGKDLVKALSRLGYEPTHQTGSHIRLRRTVGETHHLTIPAHDPIRVGTLQAILRDLCEHHQMNRETLLRTLFPH